jgi:carboxymethylenebutenolidase
VPAGDPRIRTKRITYDSPRGHGRVEGLLAAPRDTERCLEGDRRPGVLVVHENRGLNPYVEDVARRFAAEGFVALAPDGLSSVGGYPGNDDEGRTLQRGLHREALIEDFLAGAKHLAQRPECTGRVGVVGFCFGGLVSNELAVRWPELGAAVPFYGRRPEAEGAASIRCPMLFHFAENDPRVNEGWPEWKAALEANGVDFEAHDYPGTNHGFHNDTTPRFDEEAAALAWRRTVSFFREHLDPTGLTASAG